MAPSKAVILLIVLNLIHTSMGQVMCPDLPDPANGQVSLSGYTFGSFAVYTCDAGFFATSGDIVRTCGTVTPGVWSGSAPTCQENINPVRLGFLETRVTVMEQQGPAVVSVGLLEDSAILKDNLVVTFSTSEIGTAEANSDYIPRSVEMIFTAGSGPGTTMTVEITLIDDNEEEETESFSGGLSVTASQSIVVSPGSVTVDIIDNDGDLT